MKVIACTNQKGGVGKTLVSGLLAEYYSIVKKKRVVIVDLDAQCNTTDRFVGMEEDNESQSGQRLPVNPDWEEGFGNSRTSIADIFFGEGVLPYPSWIDEKRAGGGCLEVLAGSPERITEINSYFGRPEIERSGAIDRLDEFFSMEEVSQLYDVAIIDTGPSRSPLLLSAIRAASHVVIPFRPEDKDIQGIKLMMQIIMLSRHSTGGDEKPKLIGFCPNMVRRTRIHTENIKKMNERFPGYLFPKEAWISQTTDFPERDRRDADPKSIFDLAPTRKSYQQSLAMCDYVESHVGVCSQASAVEECA